MLPAVASTISAPGLMLPVALGGLDHRQRDAVLDRAAGVLVLELEEQPAGAGVEAAYLDQRGVADEIEDVVGDSSQLLGHLHTVRG